MRIQMKSTYMIWMKRTIGRWNIFLGRLANPLFIETLIETDIKTDDDFYHLPSFHPKPCPKRILNDTVYQVSYYFSSARLLTSGMQEKG